MAGVKISALPAVASALYTDFFPVVQAGVTSQETIQQVSTLFGFNGSNILAITAGGTGVGTVTTVPTADAFAAWDANSNLSANNFLSAYTTTATAAMTTTLTVSSTFQQFFTGTTTQTVTLPVANTLVLGQSYYIVNNSTGIVTVKSSGGNTVQALAGTTSALITCILASGTSAASWSSTYFDASGLTGYLPLSGGTMSGAINMGNNQINALADPTNKQDAVTAISVQQQQNVYAVDSGSANVYAIALTPAITSYTDGLCVRMRAAHTNTGSSTINVNGHGAVSILTNDANFLLSDMILIGGDYDLIFSTAAGGFILLNPSLVPVDMGGTGVDVVTTTPTATAWAGWDANKNMSANNFLSAYTTTATAAMTTTLTVASPFQQFFTGTTTQTVVLPVTSTLVLGQSFYIFNNSTGVVTVQSSGGNTVTAMAANTTLLVTCILTSGTTTASWYADYNFQTALTLPLSLSNGGTGQSLSSVNSAVFSTTSGGAAQLSTTLPAALTIPQPSITGVTNASNAAAGAVGEVISSVLAAASAYSLSNNITHDITSINLSDGDWDIWGNVTFTIGGTCNNIYAWSSASSATVPDLSLYNQIGGTALVTSGFSIPFARYNVSTPTTIYLTAAATFATSTVTACGGIYARRVR